MPLLNPSTIKWVQPNTLVRFRGMIQDMLGNEFYIGAYKVDLFSSRSLLILGHLRLASVEIIIRPDIL